ncbi:hypothetical protein [Rhodococcus sp. 008]|uniref:hypothetical protein n=1 Tax=Rhodococcus sp. 008 TaxID=1723645 RepID=UPI0008063AA2|nr:hypothetical protein [Rhodococcus sp. 008]ANQ74427.1 hypothetical protein AOT96_29130 [Rhodococcus sp. 008]
MPEQFEYVDEDGNPIDPSELEGLDYEVIDEPAPQTPSTGPDAPEAATISKSSKGIIVGALAAVLLVGGGAAFAFSQVGNKNTVDDVKSSAETARREVVTGARPPLDACDGSALKKAGWERGEGTPSLQLTVVKSVPLPAGFADRTRVSNNPLADTAILQFGDRSLGVYEENADAELGAGRWWKVAVTTAPELAVTGEAEGPGGETDAATACKTVIGGVYRVVGEGIPPSTQEMQADLVNVSALKGDGAEPTTVWAVAGDRLLKTTLEHTPDDEG